jgi:hypothetical protein
MESDACALLPYMEMPLMLGIATGWVWGGYSISCPRPIPFFLVFIFCPCMHLLVLVHPAQCTSIFIIYENKIHHTQTLKTHKLSQIKFKRWKHSHSITIHN